MKMRSCQNTYEGKHGVQKRYSLYIKGSLVHGVVWFGMCVKIGWGIVGIGVWLWWG
jgi:hypothetical protein